MTQGPGPDEDGRPDDAPQLFAAPPARFDARKKRAALIQAGISLALVLIIFGWLLPQVIDYQEIGQALASLDPWQFGVLLVAGLIVYLPEGWLYALLVPGLTWLRGIASWVGSTGVGSTIPAMDLVVRFGMYRSWGATTQSATLGIFLSGIFDNVTKFSLPVISVLLMVALGVSGIPGAIIWIAAIAAAIVTVSVVVAVGVFRSERFAGWLGRTGQSIANWFLRLFGRDEVSGLGERIIGVRDAGLGTVRAVWQRALLASALGKLWTFVILLIALRFAGIPSDVISTLQAFVVWTLVLLVGAIPLTPGGVGFVEAAYLALFGLIAGDEWAIQISVAVVLYRAAQWALPIVVGWLTVGWWRLSIKRGRLRDPDAAPAA